MKYMKIIEKTKKLLDRYLFYESKKDIIKEARRDPFAIGVETALFHVAYDNTRRRFEELNNEELCKVLDLYKRRSPLTLKVSRYLPTLMGIAGINALVDLAEERGLIQKIKLI